MRIGLEGQARKVWDRRYRQEMAWVEMAADNLNIMTYRVIKPRQTGFMYGFVHTQVVTEMRTRLSDTPSRGPR